MSLRSKHHKISHPQLHFVKRGMRNCFVALVFILRVHPSTFSMFRIEPMLQERSYVTSWKLTNCVEGEFCLRVGTMVSAYPGETDGVFFYSKVLAAITTAAEEGWERYLRRLEVGVQLHHHLLMCNTMCSPQHATGIVAHMYYDDKISAVIGPSCSAVLDHVGMLTAYWNIPILTGLGDSRMFVDKTFYPTLTRFAYCQCQLRAVFAALFHHFQFRHISLVMDTSEYFSQGMGDSLRHGLLDPGYAGVTDHLELFFFEFDSRKEKNYTHILNKASENARVVILSVPGPVLRKLMLTAHRENRTSGEWLFMDIELFPATTDWGDKGWSRNDSNDAAARKAYESILRVTLPAIDHRAHAAVEERIRKNAADIWNYTWTGDVNFFIGAYYDATMAFVETSADFLVRNRTVYGNGVEFAEALWDRPYTRGLTGDFEVGSAGDRLTEFHIADLDPVDGVFKPVAKFLFKTEELRFSQYQNIHWPNGAPPLDVPRCGFRNENPACQPKPDVMGFVAPVIAVFSAVLLLLFVAFLVTRKIKMERDLKDLHWRILWADLTFPPANVKGSSLSVRSRMTKSPLASARSSRPMSAWSGTSARSLLQTQVLTAVYRGTQVAVKKYSEVPPQLDRAMLQQMKTVSRLVHQNIVPLIGACVDLPNIAIISELCARGSLNELLHDSDMELDSVFKISLIRDIAKGLRYLHESPIRIHGNLHPANCLVDKRFVVKLCDWKLNGFLPLAKEEAQMKNCQLYWAPEVLRSIVNLSQSADLYSLGVILTEIIEREVPYFRDRETQNLDAILHKVRAGIRPLMRPQIKYFDLDPRPPDALPTALHNTIMDCLAEEPEQRPTAAIIVKLLHSLQHGKEVNIMDNLMKRMEQYTKNLEHTVQERTAALEQQQEKMEDLLSQLLPKSVATQLLNGTPVTPQYYDKSSIYFSDIVGFTVLSSLSSPMEVVTLLNDLYSLLDELILQFDCYKVETIGDAYMVVSGVPERNGEQHAKEIALWSLSVLRDLKTFKIRHMKNETIRLRVGAHSGSVVAGVVGQRMPRYCLFGDTVNTASRMESTGLPEKIQISDAMKNILDLLGGFQTERRGEQEVKGKGVMVTHWLTGATGFDEQAHSQRSTLDSQVDSGCAITYA